MNTPEDKLSPAASPAPDAPSAQDTPGAPSASPAPAPAAPDADGSDDRLRQLHRVMLMMLKDFSALCEREGITWIAMYGTALGAVRHGGFIPWDDDIDLCLMRADLERLIVAVEGDPALNAKYRMINARLDPAYPLATTRMMLRGTEFRDSALATASFESGIFLDLFPLDAVADGERAFRRQAWRAWLNNKLAIAKLVKSPYIAGGGARAAVLRAGTNGMRGLLSLPGLRNVDFNERSLREQTRYNGERTARVGFLCDTDRFSCTYRVEDLLPVRWVPFEDTEVPLAHHAEQLLAELYGDYLTPPPVEARREHYPDILDFGPYASL